MRQAIREAKKGLGRTSPNPAVGAVIVRNGQIIAKGFHKKAGGHHAEVEALGHLRGRAAPGDTLYVTLEPCNHYGKTPPCTDAIISAVIKQVILALRDPNPLVDGKGITLLRKQGIKVITGPFRTEAHFINEDYLWTITQKRAFITLKNILAL